MNLLNAPETITDEALQAYDAMMLDCVLRTNIAPLAVKVWSDVLKELDRRGKVRLISGFYDDVGNALIQRLP